jgi:chromosome segregation ATPase
MNGDLVSKNWKALAIEADNAKDEWKSGLQDWKSRATEADNAKNDWQAKAQAADEAKKRWEAKEEEAKAQWITRNSKAEDAEKAFKFKEEEAAKAIVKAEEAETSWKVREEETKKLFEQFTKLNSDLEATKSNLVTKETETSAARTMYDDEVKKLSKIREELATTLLDIVSNKTIVTSLS